MADVRGLAEIERGSCTRGEGLAADWISRRLVRSGLTPRIEREQAHGTYWWPLGLATATAAFAGGLALASFRLVGTGLALIALLLVIDEITGGRRPLRKILRRRMTSNVVVETGDAGASQTIVCIAHYDAAHTGLAFDPRPWRLLRRLWPGESRSSPPMMLPVAAGPLLVS